jgi:hypothetical protein
MKTMPRIIAGGCALLLTAALQAQTMNNNYSGSNLSIRDNPGVLGQNYADLHYGWIDYHRDHNLDADGFNAGLSGNAAVARGLDVGFGYDYFRENNHRNPFNGSAYDARTHQLATSATFFSPNARGVKPFVGGALGYEWSHGDFQRLTAYDDQWVWGVSGGAEIAVGAFAFTPRVTFSDTMLAGSPGAWHYGGEVHHWFNERFGGYVDATFHDPRHNSAPQAWTYTAGMRMRF